MKEIFGEIRGKLEEDISISQGQTVTIHGMIFGKCIVSNNSVLNLHGMVIKDLIIKDNATVYIHGTVNGIVHTEGGKTSIYGTIERLNRGNGIVEIASNAIIRK